MRTLPLVFTVLLFAAPALAATPGILGKQDTSRPIAISADKFQGDLNSKTVTYSGNVIAIQDDLRLRSDTLKDDSPNGKIYINGKVVVDSPATGTVTGDNAIYDLTKKFVTLSGHVVLHKQGQITMQGSLLTVNVVTGQATLGAQPVAGTATQAAAPGAPSGRVQAIITPKSTTP